MPSLSIAPDAVSAASKNLEGLSAALRNATSTAAARTIQVASPAADEVSEAISAIFDAQAREFQSVSAKATVFHDDFVSLLHSSAAQYLGTESANTIGVAAAGPAETISSYSIGPFEAYTQTTGYGADIGIRLNTPYGSATLFSEGVTLTGVLLPDGGYGFGFIYHFGNPLLYFGTLYGPGQTGFMINGLAFTFPGSPQLGGILPNLSYQPVYF